MDYKYIEQLLERYFQAETTLQEEQILHMFFAQDEQQLPAQLRQYRPLFAALQPAERLADDFDDRLMAQLTGQGSKQPATQRARTATIRERLRPLFRAAAIVAIVLTLGNAMNITLQQGRPAPADDINYADYKDTYDDPAVAFDKVEDALQLISDGYSRVQPNDSLQRTDSLYSELK